MRQITYKFILFLSLIVLLSITFPSIELSAANFDLYKYEQFVNEGRYHLAEDYLISNENAIMNKVTKERPTMKQTVQEYLVKNKQMLSSENASNQDKITATLQFI